MAIAILAFGLAWMDASAGQSGNSSVMKQVRVVTTIDFYLTD